MSERLTLWVASVAQLVVVLDVSVMNVALPAIRRDLGLGPIGTSWVAMGYSIAFAGALLAAARLADSLGATRVLLVSVLGFTISSVIGGLATSGWLLVAARVGQGLSAAAISPATFTLLTVTFAEGLERSRAIAIWTAVGVAGGGIGNILSGVLTELVSWRAVLLINLPIGLVVTAGAYRLGGGQRASPPAADTRPDWRTVLASLVAMGCIVQALTRFSTDGLTPRPIIIFLIGGASAVGWRWLERRSRLSLVPASLWRRPNIALGTIATLLTAICFQVGIWYFLTFRLQDDWGYSPIETGLAFVPLTGSVLVVNLFFVPRLMDRFSPRVLISTGALLAGLGALWLALTPASGFWFGLFVPSLLLGVGGGLLNTPLATVISSDAPAGDAGAVSGLLNSAKQFGGALGLALGTVVADLVNDADAAFLLMTGALLLVTVTAQRLNVRMPG
ncbi:putative MFS family arabinose efflux permease [Propionibacteriaceae bacterium ES.041]|uniref:MFS transporter n=1 Tax=Enemella evansiae TaxID=2016499 RepID=UPI000C015D64|nr:MFS transporter [Enemella evansiae]PFG68139.1 putative MFS family arabinose efflux permease [Propionibacteriaceae bacterium ES.041]